MNQFGYAITAAKEPKEVSPSAAFVDQGKRKIVDGLKTPTAGLSTHLLT